jgi:hypothetical protein
LARILRLRGRDDALQRLGNLRIQSARRRRHLVQNRVKQRRPVEMGEGSRGGCDLVEDTARGINIGARIGELGANLLGRHVRQRPELIVASAGRLLSGRRLQELRNPEVENLHAPVTRHHDIRGLQIAMDDSVVVRRLQAVGQLDPERAHFRLGQRSVANALLERDAVDVFHDEVIDIARGVEVVDSRDVRMIELREEQSFPAESFPCCFVGEAAGRQHFDRHLAIEMLVAGAVDDTHAAGTDPVEDGVVTNTFADHAYLRFRARRF